MIIDSLSKLGEDIPRPNVCIIGAGAAGISLACEFIGTGISVLLLEAGGLRRSQSGSEVFEGSANTEHPDPMMFRRIGFGGTTSVWGGRCVPLDPIDFEYRSYVNNSGWPLSFNDIAKYYPRALQYCDAGIYDFNRESSLGPNQKSIIPDLHLVKDALCERIERYSLPTHFGKRYKNQLSKAKNVVVVLGARCIDLISSEGGEKIDAIELATSGLGRRKIHADVFILALGGIETPRLLFSADPKGPGLGNRNGHLGRYYTCHTEKVCARLVPTGSAVAFDFEKTIDGVYCRRKLQFRPELLERERLLNCAFRLHFPAYSDAAHGSSVMSAIYLAKSALPSEYRRILETRADRPINSKLSHHGRNIISGLPQLTHFAIQWLFLRVMATRKLPYTLVANADGSFPIEFNSEQTPLYASRIRPTHYLDSDGVRRIHVDWRLSGDDIKISERAFMLLREIIARTGLCRIEFGPELHDQLSRLAPTGGHHIGTTRMAASPLRGVVDANCRVFERNNLYIASSAVFPTCGHANPTLTIVAIAVRLADHLKLYFTRKIRASSIVIERQGNLPTL